MSQPPYGAPPPPPGPPPPPYLGGPPAYGGPALPPPPATVKRTIGFTVGLLTAIALVLFVALVAVITTTN
ncbi:hypothetical protein [Nocardioides nitrophenolicus]|uniref:hypothetical protein n=1 Tax=Nocardioides nitrophenolicus TaxID=60489 RepID=UPI00195B5F6C|nr:hypothetical protein [Nocardioides nitrophenolicus]MBM7516853.1 hypothetical protein [Nocardioides nitrophenolicus]